MLDLIGKPMAVAEDPVPIGAAALDQRMGVDLARLGGRVGIPGGRQRLDHLRPGQVAADGGRDQRPVPAPAPLNPRRRWPPIWTSRTRPWCNLSERSRWLAIGCLKKGGRPTIQLQTPARPKALPFPDRRLHAKWARRSLAGSAGWNQGDLNYKHREKRDG